MKIEDLPEERVCQRDVELALLMIFSSNDQISKPGDTVSLLDALIKIGEAVLRREQILTTDQACTTPRR